VPNFITQIDGLDNSFHHVRSKHENALPMIVTQWMAWLHHRANEDHRSAHQSIAHGGNESDAFHLVIPSLPGYTASPGSRRRRGGTPSASPVRGRR